MSTSSSPFVIAPYSIADLGKNGGGSIEVKVQGFWSSVATLYVRRKVAYDFEPETAIETVTWACEPSHSSGGRDPKELADDLEAEDNFAQALSALVVLGRHIRIQADVLERHYVSECAVRAAELSAKKQAKLVRYAADTPLGFGAAHDLFNAASAIANGPGLRPGFAKITLINRGDLPTDMPTTLELTATRSGRVTVRKNGSVVSKADALEALSVSSHRSALRSNHEYGA